MIYVTGDTHAGFNRFTNNNFPEQKEMTKDDVVIICGDFGGIWAIPENKQASEKEEYILNNLEKRPFTICFCDGNHENFARLYQYPVTEWNGGKVHRIRDHIYHLMRGEVYTIEGKKFFVFGGAFSHDISDGILDPDEYGGYKSKEFEKAYKHWNLTKYWFRVKGVSWWPEERPSAKEYQNGLLNLEKNNDKVDFIISHEGPISDIVLLYGASTEKNELNLYLEDIRQKTEYKHWFFGHHHDNRNLNASDHLIYEQLIQIA